MVSATDKPVEKSREPGLEPEQYYKPLLNGENGRDGKIKEVERKLSNLQAGMKRKEKMIFRTFHLIIQNIDVARPLTQSPTQIRKTTRRAWWIC